MLCTPTGSRVSEVCFVYFFGRGKTEKFMNYLGVYDKLKVVNLTILAQL